MRHCGPHFSAFSAWLAIALPTSFCQDSFLYEGHGPPAHELPLTLCLSLAQPTSPRLAVLLTDRSRSPVWLSALRAYPREYVRSLRAQIRPPACSAIYLLPCLLLLVRAFLFPA